MRSPRSPRSCSPRPLLSSAGSPRGTSRFTPWPAAWSPGVPPVPGGARSQAHRWLAALGETERLSLFPLFPVEVADDPLLVRMALAAGDAELPKTVTELA